MWVAARAGMEGFGHRHQRLSETTGGHSGGLSSRARERMARPRGPQSRRGWPRGLPGFPRCAVTRLACSEAAPPPPGAGPVMQWRV